jgi:hypothetical protein
MLMDFRRVCHPAAPRHIVVCTCLNSRVAHVHYFVGGYCGSSCAFEGHLWDPDCELTETENEGPVFVCGELSVGSWILCLPVPCAKKQWMNCIHALSGQ